MKPIILIILALIVCGPLWCQNDSQRFEDAKNLFFQKNWGAALAAFDTVLGSKPPGRYGASALFYRGRCLEELNRSREAIATFQEYLKKGDNESFCEEAQVSIFDLSMALYKQGDKNVGRNLVELLSSAIKTVRYYAAIHLAKVRDKTLAAEALPLLQEIVRRENDAELRDLARISILQVDPHQLPQPEHTQSHAAGVLLRIRWNGKNDKQPLAIDIPLPWADLAVQALGEDMRGTLEKNNYSVSKLLRDIKTKQGVLFQIKSQDGEFKIWIE
jgi:hypothetical protein